MELCIEVIKTITSYSYLLPRESVYYELNKLNYRPSFYILLFLFLAFHSIYNYILEKIGTQINTR
jgi:hypothetical protein